VQTEVTYGIGTYLAMDDFTLSEQSKFTYVD
jgi:hypothetical protein